MHSGQNPSLKHAACIFLHAHTGYTIPFFSHASHFILIKSCTYIHRINPSKCNQVVVCLGSVDVLTACLKVLSFVWSHCRNKGCFPEWPLLLLHSPQTQIFNCPPKHLGTTCSLVIRLYSPQYSHLP